MNDDKQDFGNDDFLLEWLKRQEESGMQRTQQWTSIWQENMRYFFSSQMNKKKYKGWDWIVINYIWPSAMQEIAKLAKIEHKFLAIPTEDSDVSFADAWQGILQWQWEKGLNKTGMRTEQIAALFDAKMFGYFISKIYWEPKPRRAWDDKEKKWTGEVMHKLWHPAEFWASTEEKVDDGPCGTARFVRLDWAQYRWSEFRKELEDEARTYKEIIGGGESIRGQLADAGTYPSAGVGGIDSGPDHENTNYLLERIQSSSRMHSTEVNDDTKFVKLSETYFFDDRTKNQDQKQQIPAEELIQAGQIFTNEATGGFVDPDGRPFPGDKPWPTITVNKWKEPLFPNGRYIIRAGDTILNPDKQKWQFSRWPFVVMPHYLLPHMWQGVDAVQLYKGVQDGINTSVSHLMNNMKMFGDPKVAIESGALEIDRRTKKAFTIGKGPGAIIRLVRGGLARMKIIDPPQVSAGATQLYALFAQEFKNLTGLHSIGRGEQDPGEISATQAQHLAMSGFDRVFLQSIYQKQWVKEIGGLVIEMDQAFYEPGRMVRILGEDNKEGIEQISQGLKNARFDMDVEAGSALPFDDEKRMVQHQAAYQMLAEPVVNVMLPQMLKILQIPNYQNLLKKHQPWQQYVQFLELYQAVIDGKVTPEQAIQMLVERAQQEFGQGQNTIGAIEARNKEKEKLDREREAIHKEGVAEGRQREADRNQAKEQAEREAKRESDKSQ